MLLGVRCGLALKQSAAAAPEEALRLAKHQAEVPDLRGTLVEDRDLDSVRLAVGVDGGKFDLESQSPVVT